MEQSLKNKTVLITGASRGIGREIARYLAENGATIIIHYNKNKFKAESLLELLPSGKHILLEADFSQDIEVEQIVNRCISKVGRIHALVNNAGIFIQKKIADFNFNEWKQVWETTLQVNLISAAHLSFAVAKHMRETGGGKIINISSRGAFRGEPEALAYAASKAGLNSFGQSLAIALAPYNIFVYTLAPGFVETEMATAALTSPQGPSIKAQSPLKRVAQPVEIARTVGFLLSEANEYLTGSIIDINGASYLRS